MAVLKAWNGSAWVEVLPMSVDPVALALDAAFTSRYAPVATAWTALTLINSWVNFGGVMQTAQYRKEGDRVFLRGAIKTGALATTAFNLPAGFRPPATLFFTANMSAAPVTGGIYVNPTGDVQPYTGANTEVHLDGISFSTVA